MESQKLGNSPGPGPEVTRRQRAAKEQAVQRVRSWTVQNEMRGVLRRVSAGAGGRTRDSANSRDKSLTVGCARYSRDERSTASVTRKHKFLGGNRRNLVCRRI